MNNAERYMTGKWNMANSSKDIFFKKLFDTIFPELDLFIYDINYSKIISLNI